MINIIINNVRIIVTMHHVVVRIFKRLMFIQVEHATRCRSLSPLYIHIFFEPAYVTHNEWISVR